MSWMQRIEQWFPAPPCRLTRWVFLRLLGIVYGIAFLSLWVQVSGLVGTHGILPAGHYLRSAHAMAGAKAYWELPTLCWFGAGNGMLHFLCAGGTVLSIALIAGIAPPLTLFLLWVFYLSLVTVGQDFLGFQWDILLLETGFLAIFFAPRQWLPRYSTESPPSFVSLWLLRWLLFRLMFSSGMVKLGDPTWRHLKALDYHYETQPLPTVIGWYAYHLPEWFQMTSVVVMFAIELGAPFCMFGSRRVRASGCAALVGLQALILLTGNFGFFNLLTISLCLLMLDDGQMGRLLPRFVKKWFVEPEQSTPTPVYWRAATGLTAGFVFVISVPLMTSLFIPGGIRLPLTKPAMELNWAFHWVNPYGLFAHMTTERDEIVIEGSDDGKLWLPYAFKWKPGDIGRRPQWVEPYQPRLDWQMWFAALSNARDTPWFQNLMVRLLQGSRDVTALLDHNPFPRHPPRYVRALLYRYRFATMAEHARTGVWWERKEIGWYFPVATLHGAGQF